MPRVQPQVFCHWSLRVPEKYPPAIWCQCVPLWNFSAHMPIPAASFLQSKYLMCRCNITATENPHEYKTVKLVAKSTKSKSKTPWFYTNFFSSSYIINSVISSYQMSSWKRVFPLFLNVNTDLGAVLAYVICCLNSRLFPRLLILYRHSCFFCDVFFSGCYFPHIPSWIYYFIFRRCFYPS